MTFVVCPYDIDTCLNIGIYTDTNAYVGEVIFFWLAWKGPLDANSFSVIACPFHHIHRREHTWYDRNAFVADIPSFFPILHNETKKYKQRQWPAFLLCC